MGFNKLVQIPLTSVTMLCITFHFLPMQSYALLCSPNLFCWLEGLFAESLLPRRPQGTVQDFPNPDCMFARL